MKITCGRCGHEGTVESFTSTPLFGDLPTNFIQCPQCRNAFVRVGGGAPKLEATTPFLVPLTAPAPRAARVNVRGRKLQSIRK